ncbi:uncharacterized protein LOC121416729 [Lytechinus variegatus]|uniref:uncharacterized protein LOC121416729 n=1 Tax=Lytechinus variegatus TaxID=7654 RepID=UPI001BB21ADA|nr:uncharacterized protein LOC121416729 [Lytechinus variegatus]
MEIDKPLVLDPVAYTGFSFPYHTASWYIQSVDGYDIGVNFPKNLDPLRDCHLALKVEPTEGTFRYSWRYSQFVLVQHPSLWLFTDTVYQRSLTAEISIQPSQELSLDDPCSKVDCGFSDCTSLDIHLGYVCSCKPGFQGVNCKNG